MEKNRQELVDNYKAEQRAIKIRKVLAKTKEWGENLVAILFIVAVGLAVTMILVTIWRLGLGFIVIGVGLALTVVGVWNLVDNWTYNELEKARHQRYKKQEEGK